mgnify:CR=1 FL=1
MTAFRIVAERADELDRVRHRVVVKSLATGSTASRVHGKEMSIFIAVAVHQEQRRFPSRLHP